MSVTGALARFGVTSSHSGPPPECEQDYLDRVDILTGIRPPWSEVRTLLVEDARAAAFALADEIADFAVRSLDDRERPNAIRDLRIEEACRLRDDVHVDASNYPVLAAGCDEAGPDALRAAAAEALAAHSRRAIAVAAVEARRHSARKRIRAAASIAEISGATAALNSLRTRPT